MFTLSRVTLVTLGLFVSACTGIPVETEDARHYVIVGFGVVTVPRSDPEQSVAVHRLHSLGLSVSDHPGLKLGLGYVSGLVTSVPGHLDHALVEVSQRPFGPIRVSIGSDQSRAFVREELDDESESMD